MSDPRASESCARSVTRPAVGRWPAHRLARRRLARIRTRTAKGSRRERCELRGQSPGARRVPTAGLALRREGCCPRRRRDIYSSPRCRLARLGRSCEGHARAARDACVTWARTQLSPPRASQPESENAIRMRACGARRVDGRAPPSSLSLSFPSGHGLWEVLWEAQRLSGAHAARARNCAPRPRRTHRTTPTTAAARTDRGGLRRCRRRPRRCRAW